MEILSVILTFIIFIFIVFSVFFNSIFFQKNFLVIKKTLNYTGFEFN